MKKIDYSLFDFGVRDYAADFLKGSSPVFSCARPFALRHTPKAEAAVLLLHGFTGYPGELVRPAVDLYEAGLDVLVIRHPGHGTCTADFLASDDRMWLECSEAAYLDLAGSYRTVYVGGHSMGGLIATVLAERHPIPRLILLAPAIKIRNAPWRAWFLRPFTRGLKNNWTPDPTYKMYYENSPCDDLAMGKEYWSALYPKPVCHLDHLSRVCRRNLGKITSDALVLFGDNDLTCDPDGGRLLGNRSQGTTTCVTIPDGTHLLPYDRDIRAQDEAVEECVKHLTR